MNFCGVINLDKPIGMTSRDVVNQVVRLVRPAKVGHVGTLDPLATGVLLVCVGHATRLISFAHEGRKRYLGRFLLGRNSNTDDITGNVTLGGDATRISRDQLEALIPDFVGRISQIPPQFSAVHVQGERAYDLARRGETVELAARPVEVFSLQLTTFQPPEFELDIVCGSGTYIRSIGRDWGSRLGCGAVMTRLRRLEVGPFRSDDAIKIESLTRDNIQANLQPALSIVRQFQERRLSAEEIVAIRRGQSIPLDSGLSVSHHTSKLITCLPASVTRFSLVQSDGLLVGIGEKDRVTQRIHPRIVFPDEAMNERT